MHSPNPVQFHCSVQIDGLYPPPEEAATPVVGDVLTAYPLKEVTENEVMPPEQE